MLVKDVCTLIVDCVNRTAPVVDFETPYRMIRTTNVRNGRIDISGCRYVTEETFRRWTRRAEVLDGDVILTREAPIGEVGFVQGMENIFLGQHIMQYRPNPRKVDPRFFFYVFRSPDLQKQFGSYDGSGSVVSHIRVADCHNFSVPVAPYAEQIAISNLLGALDDKIDLNRRMNETLEAMARVVFKDWFVDFGPVRAKAEGRQPPGLSPDIADLFPDALDDEDKPVGWSVSDLGAFAQLNSEAWSRQTAPTEITYVDLSNTKWGEIEATQVFSWEDAPSRAQRILRSGDTIVGTVRPGNGSYAYVSEEGLTGSTGFAVLRPVRTEVAEFVYLAATAPDNIDRLAHLADGGAYPAVRPDAVLATEVPSVPSSALTAFSAISAPLLGKIAANRRESATLAQLRDLLLPKLMSGEIRLKDAERAVENAI